MEQSQKGLSVDRFSQGKGQVGTFLTQTTYPNAEKTEKAVRATVYFANVIFCQFI